MRIEDIRVTTASNSSRLVANVIWEDCELSPQEIFIETSEEFADELSPGPHPFLIACMPPALLHQERRLAVREPICPELRNGLLTAMEWLRHWYGPDRCPVQIEAPSGIRMPTGRSAERASAFLSGGIDSLATVRANQLDYGSNHPRSIRDCLFAYGFDVGGFAGTRELYESALRSLSRVTEHAGMALIPVGTNLLQLHGDVEFWMHEFHGAAFAAIAHAFAKRLSLAFLASSFAIDHLVPWGSHPLIDSQYSSTELQFRHDGLRLSRLEKVRLVAGWDVALQNLRVCTGDPPPGYLNCGRCEKCLRTMIELTAVGKLGATNAFPSTSVSYDTVKWLELTSAYQAGWYREVVDPLRSVGREDLADLIQTKLDRLPQYLDWLYERDWKGTVKRFDRRYLSGTLYRLRQATRDRTGI